MNRTMRIFFGTASILLILTLIMAGLPPVRQVQARGLSAIPKAPAGMVTDTTPTYRWTVLPDASQYEYELYKKVGGTYSTYIYRKKVTGFCGATTCTHNPGIILSLASYRWRIRSWLGSSASSWSAWQYFQIVPPPTDFTSEFNGSYSGWVKNPGPEWYVNSSYLYTSGQNEGWASMYRSTSPAFANFDYEIRVRRDTADVNCLLARMGSSFAPNNIGYPGYLFCYENGGKYFVVYINASGTVSYLQPWTTTPYIKAADWNKLRVTAIGGYFWFRINGQPVHEPFLDNSRSLGKVGFSMFKSIAGFTEFDVDKAYLDVLMKTAAAPADFVVDPEQQALNDAALLEGSTGDLDLFPLP